MAAEEGWVGIAEVAAHLRVARDTVYRWVDTKGLPAHRGGTVATLQALGSGRVGSGWAHRGK